MMPLEKLALIGIAGSKADALRNALADLEPCRQVSIATTKLDELELWLGHRAEEIAKALSHDERTQMQRVVGGLLA